MISLNTTREERLRIVMQWPLELGGHISEANTKKIVEIASDAIVLEDELDRVREELERRDVQLAGCSVAAHDGSIEQEAKPDAYGWSPAYADVLKLRRENDKLREELESARRVINTARVQASGCWPIAQAIKEHDAHTQKETPSDNSEGGKVSAERNRVTRQGHNLVT